ncbi:Gfo/Idh/MocA family protein [Janthinobacterium psychrotolerans]|uniref:UDP-N-acetyl-2-amino-2-deoxyglucuronate dehydrogenase n=1 Tax=Janthinobacterium psychrotolerans TaxID=1747903 RepID=A0A1A7C7M7_9BURK|nr:Gfo/Idh/MocA family oxidoreductase [Janthinobacterium psychrotolerans]OBV40313.1 UDP-N-acetyl-2-amino-2-deoxyglucuronate dehydrogenase [Janthinobacterium psychrotolerans]
MQNYQTITDRKIRIALVGCGRIANNHLDAMEKHAADFEIVDVCDIDAQALERAVARTGASGHIHLSDMLTKTTADVVVLTTPSGLHANQAIEVARTGRHVVTEKPMATRWQDGLRMVRACDEANVRLFVVKQNRRNATLQLLKRAAEQGRFGRIYNVAINVFWTRPQEYYDSAKWRGTWEFDGGAFMNQASHYIDLFDWIVGPVESVMAYTATLGRDIEVEDSGVAALRWRSGAMGTLNVTMLTYPKNMEGSITILGEKGTVRIGGVAVNEIQKWEFSEPHEDDKCVKDVSYETTSVYGFGHPLYYQNVIQTLRGTASAETDGREGLKSLELLIAMYMSSRDGKRIALPLEY